MWLALNSIPSHLTLLYSSHLTLRLQMARAAAIALALCIVFCVARELVLLLVTLKHEAA